MSYARTCLLILLTASHLIGGERTVHDIFVNGQLAKGVTLKNGRVEGNQIRTVSLGKVKWADPMFELRGLDIDISTVDLAQVHLRIVTGGSHKNKPSYSDVRIYTSSGPIIHVKQFPFRSWRKKDPNYMMKSLEYIGGQYAKTPKGKNFGSIKGFAIKTAGGFAMQISKVQILIDASLTNKYPDDPKPDPKWQGGSIKDVFALPVSERLYLKQQEHPLIKQNTVWRNGTIHLSAAKNETTAFQIIMQAASGKAGVNNVDVKFPGLTMGKERIDNSKAENPNDPYDYVGRHIQLYRTRYVFYPSGFGDKGKKIAVMNGSYDKWIPEIQIPFEAKWGGAPFSIFPGQNQAVWIDIYVPPTAKAGLYKGTVTVTHGGKTVRALPVELTVHDFALPMKPAVVGAMLCNLSDKHGAKTPEEKVALEKVYRQFFRRHHCEFFRGFRRSGGAGGLADPDQWLLRSGKIYTAEHGYAGPGEGVPTTFLFIRMYGGGLKPFGGKGLSGSEADWHKGLLPYLQAQRKYAPKATLSYYVWDEPSHAFKGGTKAFAAWFNKTAGPFVDSFNRKHGADIKLYSSIKAKDEVNMPLMDIYTASTREECLAMRKKGDIPAHWNGPQSIGHYASGLRIVGWKAAWFDSAFWWMWHANAYSFPFDVYRDVFNFRNQYGEVGGGYGMFVYPGTDICVRKRSPGLRGPVGGSRLFNWRQGFIDAEYVALARKKNPEETLKLVQSMIKDAKVNSGLPGENQSAGYPIGEAPYAAARAKLVKIILGK